MSQSCGEASSGEEVFAGLGAEPSVLASDVNYITAALSTYSGGPASDDVSAAWARILIALHGAEASAWQPIETAPRDGTRVLLGYTDAGDYDIASWVDGHGWTDQFCDTVVVDPTHWQPLRPPKADSQEGR